MREILDIVPDIGGLKNAVGIILLALAFVGIIVFLIFAAVAINDNFPFGPLIN